MGNTSTSSQPSNTEIHERLGSVKITEYVNQFSDTVQEMEFSKTVESEKEVERWKKNMNKIDDTLSRQIILLPSKYIYETTGMCGSNGVIHLKYEHFPYVLEGQITNRRNINRNFLQTQVWYLLYNLIRAQAKFQKLHQKIGDVHPRNILINNDGQTKLISTCSIPGEDDNYTKFIQNPKYTSVFLAPEQLSQEAIRTGMYPRNVDPNLAECFSIGVTMLSAGTLQTCEDIYSFGSNSIGINKNKVNQLIKRFGQKYSSFLQSIVMGLLNFNPNQRKRANEIYQSLYQYEDKILDLQQFMPQNSRMPSYSNSNQPQLIYQQPSQSNYPQSISTQSHIQSNLNQQFAPVSSVYPSLNQPQQQYRPNSVYTQQTTDSLYRQQANRYR